MQKYHRDWNLPAETRMCWEDYQRTEWNVGGAHRVSAVDKKTIVHPKMVFSSSQQPWLRWASTVVYQKYQLSE